MTASKLDPATRRMAEADPDCFIYEDDAGREHVIDVTKRPGPKAREVAAKLGISQLRQADQQRSQDQVQDTAEDEARIRRDQKARHDAEVAAHKKMFGFE